MKKFYDLLVYYINLLMDLFLNLSLGGLDTLDLLKAPDKKLKFLPLSYTACIESINVFCFKGSFILLVIEVLYGLGS